MSVLNQSGEEQVECPLCMEPLEVDDLNFYPCTCGYQICRFCWHRIRTDENGLCPACRKAYSENPADFTPLSKEQVAQLKAEKRQRDQQRKAKLSESRKHLANIRVVQKNLVFVVGLPMRLADPEILKRHEYFGKFGKIHKVVINQSNSYAGSQGPSASAYVTYMKSEDALRAIQSVNNIMIDGRTVKTSLGTTKYCSHFMKNQSCPKSDCMYLHDFGDQEASFTKDEMHAGKHQEYEKKLHEALVAKIALQGAQQQTENGTKNKNKDGNSSNNNNNKEGWPQLNNEGNGKEAKGGATVTQNSDKKGDGTESKKGQRNNRAKSKNNNESRRDKGKGCETKSRSQERDRHSDRGNEAKTKNADSSSRETSVGRDSSSSSEKSHTTELSGGGMAVKLQLVNENSSFFSQNAFQKLSPAASDLSGSLDEEESIDHHELPEHSTATNTTSHILNDSLPNIDSSEDWEAAFGFAKRNSRFEETPENRKKDSFGGGSNGFVGFLGRQPDLFGTNDTTFDTTKLHDSILDVLNSKNQFFSNSFSKSEDRLGVNGVMNHNNRQHHNSQMLSHHQSLYSLPNGVNGLDHHMSKFFTDFCSKSGQNGALPNGMNGYNTGASPNGLHGNLQPHTNGFLHSLADRHNFLVMQQKQIEEQLLSLKQQQQLLQHQQHNGTGSYLNGDLPGFPTGNSFGPLYHHHNQQQRNHMANVGGQHHFGGNSGGKQSNKCAEDELDFDPFHETQKALAELIETEKVHSNGGGTGSRANMTNGLVSSSNQTGNGGHLPPPPPGFVQPTNHMNSFGSKILPYLNMNSNQHQQQMNGGTQQNNWPGNYNPIHQQQHKNNCNDWKVLDPAIVSSSRHYPLANSVQYNNGPLQTQNGQMRSAFGYSNFPGNSVQSPSSNGFGNFSHHLSNSMQQNLNWLAGTADIGAQLSSPPGFRTAAGGPVVGKTQQEC